MIIIKDIVCKYYINDHIICESEVLGKRYKRKKNYRLVIRMN